MQLHPDDPIVDTAVFGRQVEDFLESDIGQYLMQCAKGEMEEARDEVMGLLKRPGIVPPDEILKAQNRIRVASLFIRWLESAVEAGFMSLEQLREDA